MVIRLDRIVYTSKFEHEVRKFGDRKVKERLEKTIKKIIENPEIGKPLIYALKGERTIRIPPFRLIYAINGNSLILLRFEHRSDLISLISESFFILYCSLCSSIPMSPMVLQKNNKYLPIAPPSSNRIGRSPVSGPPIAFIA